MPRTREVRGGGGEQATYPKNGGECNLTKGWWWDELTVS